MKAVLDRLSPSVTTELRNLKEDALAASHAPSHRAWREGRRAVWAHPDPHEKPHTHVQLLDRRNMLVGDHVLSLMEMGLSNGPSSMQVAAPSPEGEQLHITRFNMSLVVEEGLIVVSSVDMDSREVGNSRVLSELRKGGLRSPTEQDMDLLRGELQLGTEGLFAVFKQEGQTA